MLLFFFIAIFCIFFFWLCLRDLERAILLLIALLPAYQIRFSILGIPATLLECMILIAFVVWLFRYSEIFLYLKNGRGIRAFWSARRERTPYPFRHELSILLAIAFLSAGVSGFSNEALGIWKAYFFEPALLYIMIINRFHNQYLRLIGPLAVSAFAVSAFAIFQAAAGGVLVPPAFWNEATRRVTSIYPYPNAVGLYLAPIAMVLTGYVFQKMSNCRLPIFDKIFGIKKEGNAENNKSHWELLFIASIPLLSLFAVYFAKSKGALLGLGVAGFIFACLAGRRTRIAAAIIFLLAVTAALFVPILREKSVEQLTLSGLSGEIRKQQWRETWQMLTASPDNFIFGAGLAGYQSAVKPYHQDGIFYNKDRDPDFRRKIVLFDENYKRKYWQPTEIYLYPHNIFLNFWSELGLAGLVLFIWFFAKLMISSYGAFRNPEPRIQIFSSDYRFIAIGILCSLVAIIIHGLVDVPYFKNDLAAMFWLLAAMVAAGTIRPLEAKQQ